MITALSLTAALLAGGVGIASASLSAADSTPPAAVVVMDAEAKSAAAQAVAARSETHAAAVAASKKAVADEAARVAAEAKLAEEKAAQEQAEAEAAQAALAAQVEMERQQIAQAQMDAQAAAVAPAPAPVQEAPAPVAVDSDAPTWIAGSGGSADPSNPIPAIDSRIGWVTASYGATRMSWSHIDDAGAPMLYVSVGDLVVFDGQKYRITAEFYGDMRTVTAWENSQAGQPGVDHIFQTCTDAIDLTNGLNPNERAITAQRI